MRDITKLFIIFVCVFLLSGCINNEAHIRWGDINLFRDTPAWELICAIEDDNAWKIKKIIRESPKILDYREPQWGLTPLQRAVGKRKYKAAEMLLILGANPNVRLKNGMPLIFDAIDPEWGECIEENDTRMLELLLKYGADPNFNEEEGKIRLGSEERDRSPLIYANRPLQTLDKTKLLVEYGADVNYATKYGTTAAIEALESGLIENAHLLIAEKAADITKPYYTDTTYIDKTTGSVIKEINYRNSYYPADDLIRLMYPLDSKEYQLKKEIIQAFEAQGVDYNQWKKDGKEWIVRWAKERVKEDYPDNWEEYFEKY